MLEGGGGGNPATDQYPIQEKENYSLSLHETRDKRSRA